MTYHYLNDDMWTVTHLYLHDTVQLYNMQFQVPIALNNINNE